MKKRLLKPIQNRAIVWQHLDVIKPLNFTNGVLSINKDNLDAWNSYADEISAIDEKVDNNNTKINNKTDTIKTDLGDLGNQVVDLRNSLKEEISALKKDWKEIQFTIGTGSCFIEFDTKGAKEICFAGRIRENQTRNYIGIAGVFPAISTTQFMPVFWAGQGLAVCQLVNTGGPTKYELRFYKTTGGSMPGELYNDGGVPFKVMVK